MLGGNSHAAIPKLARSQEQKKPCPERFLMSEAVERVTVSPKELAAGLPQCWRPAGMRTPVARVTQDTAGSIQFPTKGQPVTHKQGPPILAAGPCGSYAGGGFELDSDTL